MIFEENTSAKICSFFNSAQIWSLIKFVTNENLLSYLAEKIAVNVGEKNLNGS